MQKVNLSDAVSLLLSEETFSSGQAMLHQWFVDQNKAIYEDLMRDDDGEELESLTTSIKDDKAEIESEEFYGESDESDNDQNGDIIPLKDGSSELQTDMEKLKVIFNEIIGGQSDLGVDLNGDGVVDSDQDAVENSGEFEDHATLPNDNEEEV